MSRFTKTSVQLEDAVMDSLRAAYPALSRSEIVRLALEYILLKRPEIARRTTMFIDKEEGETSA